MKSWIPNLLAPRARHMALVSWAVQAAFVAGCASFESRELAPGAGAAPVSAKVAVPERGTDPEEPIVTESLVLDAWVSEPWVETTPMELPDELVGEISVETPKPGSPGPNRRPTRSYVAPAAAQLEAFEETGDGESPEGGAAFDSTTFDDNSALNGGFLFIPPDSHAAAGPSHVVTVLNCAIRTHNKSTGASVAVQSLAGFFAALTPANATFDPRVVFDEHSRRFVVVTLEMTDTAGGDPANTSRILVAVSDDDNPIGTWYFTAINSKLNIGGLDHWFDYPEIAVDEEAVYITGNMFRFAGGPYGGTRLYVIQKAGYFTPPHTAVTTALINPYTVGGSFATTTAPAMVFPPTPAAVGTFLMSYSRLNDGTNVAVQWIRLNNPLTAPALSGGFVSLGTIVAIDTLLPFPDAPQSGTANTVETNDSRALSAVYRGNDVWMTMMTTPGTASAANVGQVTATWARLDFTNTAAPFLQELGFLGGEDVSTGSFTTFPAVAVNHGNHAAFGYSTLDNSIFPSAHFSLKLAGSAAGSSGSSQVVKTGTDHYRRTFGGPLNRWGDYSAVAVDPKDGCFWIYNQWAMTRGTVDGFGHDGRWATSVVRACPWIFGDDWEFRDNYRWSAVTP